MSSEEIRMFPVTFGEDFDLYFADDEGLKEDKVTVEKLNEFFASDFMVEDVRKIPKPNLFFLGLECDHWKKERCLGHKVFRNISNDVLMVRLEPKNDAMPVFEHMTDPEMKPGCGMHFTFHYYKDYTLEEGLPVAFSVLVENKTYSMYCKNDGGEKIIRFREEVPSETVNSSSDIIFIQKSFSPTNTKAFKFESSLMRGYFLAFKEENNLRKLILKQCKNEDQVNEYTKITVS